MRNIIPGTVRPAHATTTQDWQRLRVWLAERDTHLGDVEPRQFSGGVANLNYLVDLDGRPAVLRRPPSGPLAEGANDMAREWLVLSRLNPGYPLAPKGILLCEDPNVLGAPFQLIEYRAGISIGGKLPPELANQPSAPAALTAALVDALTSLHRVVPSTVGLGSLGRPDGFLARQVEGWLRRADAANDGARPAAINTIASWLRQRIPPDPQSPTLLHSDLKLDNLLVDPASLTATAVIDWDMATRGDPLFDLAVLLSYWIEPGDPPCVRRLRQVPSLEPGFPSRRTLAERYLGLAGRPLDTDLGFHLTLARLRLAVAWQQLHRQYRLGALVDPKYGEFADIASAILDWTAATLNNPPL